MISTASRVGTGNIAGIATALAAGGPGAVFWMWLMAVIGGASAFVESTLAQIYKVRDGASYRGGPSYYIEQALHSRKWGIVFSLALIACFAYGFNGLQSYNISSALPYYIPDYSQTIWPVVVGAVLAVLTALVIFGGVHRIGFITSVIVPVMAFGYIGMGLYMAVRKDVYKRQRLIRWWHPAQNHCPRVQECGWMPHEKEKVSRRCALRAASGCELLLSLIHISFFGARDCKSITSQGPLRRDSCTK